MKIRRAVVRAKNSKLLILWSGRPGSNRRRPAWEAGILPLNYSRLPDFRLLSCF
jgi:hypothetical protein